MAIRFCNHCEQPFQEGYIMHTHLYYCDDTCLEEANPELTPELRTELYEEDELYYTEWHSEEPKLNLIQVYTHPNTDSLWINQEDTHQNWFFAGKMHEKVESKWILVTEEEENDLLEEKSFIHTENRTFNSLKLAKSAYLEEEDTI